MKYQRRFKMSFLELLFDLLPDSNEMKWNEPDYRTDRWTPEFDSPLKDMFIKVITVVKYIALAGIVVFVLFKMCG